MNLQIYDHINPRVNALIVQGPDSKLAMQSQCNPVWSGFFSPSPCLLFLGGGASSTQRGKKKKVTAKPSVSNFSPPLSFTPSVSPPPTSFPQSVSLFLCFTIWEIQTCNDITLSTWAAKRARGISLISLPCFHFALYPQLSPHPSSVCHLSLPDVGGELASTLSGLEHCAKETCWEGQQGWHVTEKNLVY